MKLINQFPRTVAPATQYKDGLLAATDKTRIDNMFVMYDYVEEPASNDIKQIWIGDK